MKSKRLKNDLIIILISSFIVIVCWIGFNIYNKAVASTISGALIKQIQPIAPAFDFTTVNNLTKRQRVQPLFDLPQSDQTNTTQLSPQSSPTETPTPSVTIPSEDNSGSVTSIIQNTTPIASPSGREEIGQ